MQIDTRTDGSALTLTLTEPRLDAAVASNFRDQLFGHIDGGAELIVVDLCHVEFVDSSGLGALISGLKRLGSSGELQIANANDTVMNLFKMTRLDRVLKIIETSSAG